jgi:hypothetical protein
MRHRMEINWRPGGFQGYQPTLYAGDTLLAAVRVRDSHDASKEWWEFSVITVTETGFDCEGSGWGWSWEEVEWWIPVREMNSLPVAKQDVYHADAVCGHCRGPLEVHRDAICEECVPQERFFETAAAIQETT